MQIIIVEDEKPAAQKLKKAVEQYNSGITVVAILGSIREAISWLAKNEHPQLAFMDISLGDGLSFKIFEQVNINFPVIFTTAYDEYWQEAFEHNSIEYLLKPVKQEKLEAALKKFETLKKHFTQQFQQLQSWQQGAASTYKKRFLVKRGSDYISVKTDDIAYLFATHKLVCIVDCKNQKFILDQSLSDLEKQLDPSRFFRITRKHLINIQSVTRMQTCGKGKLRVDIIPEPGEEIIIAQENVAAFKEWMAQ